MTPRVSVQTTAESRHFFRGVETIGRHPALTGALQASWLGWSAGATWTNILNEDRAAATAFLGYHYALGVADVGGGISENWSQEDRRNDPLEGYVEIAARPFFLQIRPMVSYYVRLSGRPLNYGEVKLSRTFTAPDDRWEAASFVKLGFGNFYSQSYSANHLEAGLQLAWRLDDTWALGLEGDAATPLNGVRAFTGRSATSWFGGLSLRSAPLRHRQRPRKVEQPELEPTGSLVTDFESVHYYRGFARLGNQPAATTSFEAGWLGWSGGAAWTNVLKHDRAEVAAYFGYHYPLGPVDVGGGLAENWAQNDGRTDPLEGYLEISAAPLWWGLAPALSYNIRLSGRSINYGEIRISRWWRFPAQKVDLGLTAKLSFGNFYSDRYTANHGEIDGDLIYHLSQGWSAGMSLKAIAPFAGIRQRVDNTTTKFVAGFSVRKNWE